MQSVAHNIHVVFHFYNGLLFSLIDKNHSDQHFFLNLYTTSPQNSGSDRPSLRRDLNPSDKAHCIKAKKKKKKKKKNRFQVVSPFELSLQQIKWFFSRQKFSL